MGRTEAPDERPPRQETIATLAPEAALQTLAEGQRLAVQQARGQPLMPEVPECLQESARRRGPGLALDDQRSAEVLERLALR